MSHELGPSVVMVALIGIIETIAIVKTFVPAERQIDANQEILALGLANIFGSFTKAMPTSGAFCRAALASATRSKTTMNGLFAGIIVFITILCLTPYFYYVPQSIFFIFLNSYTIGSSSKIIALFEIVASLASVTISSVIFLIDIKVLTKMWRSNKYDMIPFAVTFASGLLFGIHYGLLIGVIVDSLRLLRSTVKPHIKVEKRRVSQNIILPIFNKRLSKLLQFQ